MIDPMMNFLDGLFFSQMGFIACLLNLLQGAPDFFYYLSQGGAAKYVLNISAVSVHVSCTCCVKIHIHVT